MKIPMGKEKWRPIAGYEGLYEVSNMGKVRNSKGTILKGATNTGYHIVVLSKNGKKRAFPTHRLVAQAFIPNTRGVKCVNHIDECKTNNNVSNLEWVTQKENMNHGSVKERISKARKEYCKQNPLVGCKPVRCVETGEVYVSAKEAGEELGLCRGLISGVLHGWHQTAGGYHWEWA